VSGKLTNITETITGNFSTNISSMEPFVAEILIPAVVGGLNEHPKVRTEVSQFIDLGERHALVWLGQRGPAIAGISQKLRRVVRICDAGSGADPAKR
jgi:hypothetical protein